VSVLPATGSAIAMGRVNQAFSNWAPGTGSDANGSVNPSGGGKNIKLSAILGASYGGKSAGTAIQFSSTFGGKTAPYTY
jgi:hypothetical protein